MTIIGRIHGRVNVMVNVAIIAGVNERILGYISSGESVPEKKIIMSVLY